MTLSALIPKTNRRLLAYAVAFAAFALSAALIGQYGFDLHPCDLCILQRYPYAAIVLLGGFSCIVVKQERILRLILALCGALLLIDAGIAAYHAGVEMGWIPGPTACSADTAAGQTLEEIRAAIMNAPLVTCAQAMAYVMGLSLAAWNAIAATIAAGALFFFMRKIP